MTAAACATVNAAGDCLCHNEMVLIEKLPHGCYALMVHRHYVNRVKDAMLKTNESVNNSWHQISSAAIDVNDDDDGLHVKEATVRERDQPTINNNMATLPFCQTIEFSQQQQASLKGKRKDRRGYQMLLFQHSQLSSLMELSPLARQNISWATPIQYRIQKPIHYSCQTTCRLDDSSSLANNIHNDPHQRWMGNALWRLLLEHQASFDVTKHVLRIDAFPIELSADIAKGLQMAATLSISLSKTREQDVSIPRDDVVVLEDPYSGPMEMTRSVSNCTHVLTVLSVTASKYSCDGGDYNYYVSVIRQVDHVQLLLNDHASQQVLVEPTDERTGLDLHSNVPSHVPVSRAYYKLLQVWQEYLHQPLSLSSSSLSSSNNNNTIGLDLGAAPGGWTQVLLEHFQLSHVLAVDTAHTMAHRILHHATTMKDRVVHVQADLSHHVETARAIYQAMLQRSQPSSSSSSSSQQQQQQHPISLISHVVCDSSTDSHRILPNVVQLVEQLSSLPFVTWTRPSYWVVTLKLPYKTAQSVQRNLDKVVDTIPLHLRRLASLCYSNDDVSSSSVVIDYQIVHLMANSDSERTLIAIFR